MILDLHNKLKSKKISSVELTQHYLKRIQNDKTNSFITVCEDQALNDARQADQDFQQSKATLLTGIPLAIKDILCTKGVRTTCASKILGDYRPPYDATAVRLLKEQHSVILGKLNMDEFAMGGSNENSAFGPVKNPVHLDYVPGGSSGGSAAAVKAGLAVATLGTDTGGSVRLPAAFTGIVGLKPTYGSVSRYGLIAFSSSLDQVGPLTTDVKDCAIVLSTISKMDQKDSTSFLPKQNQNFLELLESQKSKKYKIGVPKEYFIGGLQRSIEKRLDELKSALQKAGHELVEVSLPHTSYSVAIYYIVAVSEASSNLARFDGVRFGSRLGSDLPLIDMYKKTRSQFGEEVKRRVILGTFALSSGYYDAYYKRACQVRRLVQQDFNSVFKNVDVILAPVSPNTAYKFGEKTADPLQMYLNDIFTIPANLAGLPALSVPVGRDEKNLPIGVQFIGSHYDEASILSLGEFVEERFYKEEVDHGI